MPLTLCSPSQTDPIDPSNYVGNMTGTNWKGYGGSGTLTCTPIDATTASVDGGAVDYTADNLVIPDFVTDGTNTYKVTTIDDTAFGRTTLLTGTLTIGNNVTTISGGAFSACTGLTGLTIGNSVTSIGDMAFMNCSNFTGDLIIPNSVTAIGEEAFIECSNFTGLTIHDNVTAIGDTAFSGCTNLTYNNVTLSHVSGGGGTYKIIDTGNFKGLIDFSSIMMNAAKVVGSLAFGTLDNAVYTQMVLIGTIPSKAFFGCTGLIGTLVIPSGITTIGDRAFQDCSSLDGTLTIPSSVTNIGSGAFRNCSGIDSIVGNFNAAPTIGSSAFINFKPSGTVMNNGTTYSRLALLALLKNPGNLPSGWGAQPYKMDGTDWEGYESGRLTMTFDPYDGACIETNDGYNATNLIIPDYVTDGTTTYPVARNGDNSFANCTGLKGSLTFGNNFLDISERSFSGCSNITSLVISSVDIIEDGAFENCTSLTGTLTIPSSVTAIGGNVFIGCKFTNVINNSSSFELANANSVGANCYILLDASTSGTFNYAATAADSQIIGAIAFGQLIIPSTGVTSIGQGAFQDCKGLTGNLTIPNSVTSIGSSAFRDAGFSGVLTLSNNSALQISDYAFLNDGFSSIIGNFSAAPAAGTFTNSSFVSAGPNGGTVTNNPGTGSYASSLLLTLLIAAGLSNTWHT